MIMIKIDTRSRIFQTSCGFGIDSERHEFSVVCREDGIQCDSLKLLNYSPLWPMATHTRENRPDFGVRYC